MNYRFKTNIRRCHLYRSAMQHDRISDFFIDLFWPLTFSAGHLWRHFMVTDEMRLTLHSGMKTWNTEDKTQNMWLSVEVRSPVQLYRNDDFNAQMCCLVFSLVLAFYCFSKICLVDTGWSFSQLYGIFRCIHLSLDISKKTWTPSTSIFHGDHH